MLAKNGVRSHKKIAKKAAHAMRDGRTSSNTKSFAAGVLVNRKKKS
jgi:hypothetical protein